MRNIFILLLMLCSTSLVAQNAGNILPSRDYIYPTRPVNIPMLVGTQLYKTSVDSIFVSPNQVNGLSTLLNNKANLVHTHEISSIIGLSTALASKNDFKVWTGTITTDSNGLGTVNYSSAGFTSVPTVIVVAYSNDASTAPENANFVSIVKGSKTTTSAQVRTKNAVSAGLLLGYVNVNVSCDVQVLVIGN